MPASIVPDAGLRTESAGKVLLGGQPFRVLRLSSAGARSVRSWFTGDAHPSTEQEVALASRLIASGLAHPRPAPVSVRCHVIIPFRGPVSELQATLEPLLQAETVSITVIDDGSQSPIPDLPGVTVLRHEQSAGPAAARNTGWRHVAERAVGNDDAVVFVDGGVITTTDAWLEQLGGHLADGEVAAVAPRVASAPGTSTIERYEEIFSPLDLGPSPSLVGPGRLVTYVPTACLMVRLTDLVEANGFDEALRYGEDVDLIWRLSERKQIRYDPSVVVHHGPRGDLRSFASQRFHYATAAAALDRRHPNASAPWKSSLVGAASIALLSAGRPIAGALVGLAPVKLLAEQLEHTATPTPTSVRLLTEAHRWAVRSFAENMGRSWIAFAAIASLTPALRKPSMAWMTAGWLRRAPKTLTPKMLALGIVDDASYGAGVIAGAIRQRSVRSLVPSISRWG